MKESDLRRWHRNMGILLALFVILQAGSGVLITVDSSVGVQSHGGGPFLWHKTLGVIHYGAGTLWAVYRVMLGIGIVLMAVSGSIIFFKVRARSRKR